MSAPARAAPNAGAAPAPQQGAEVKKAKIDEVEEQVNATKKVLENTVYVLQCSSPPLPVDVGSSVELCGFLW